MSMVSIIMPAYNAERYVETAIQSVIAQTFEDWELIVIDDASTDGTAEIVQRISEQDVRIQLFQNSQNLGVSLTRNRGLGIAMGAHVAFLDSDDVWMPEKLQLQLNRLQQTNADLCFTAYATMQTNGEGLSRYSVPQSITYTGLLKENVIGCSTVLVKRSHLNDNSFEPNFFHEDYVLWLHLLKARCIAVGIDEVLVNYRRGGRSQDKVNAARKRWNVYRSCEKLPLFKSSYYFLFYCFNGLKKRIRAR